MDEDDNIFRRLSLVKPTHNKIPKACNMCQSGLVHVRHFTTNHDFVFKCKCVLGNARKENYKVWDNDMNYSLIWVQD